MSDDNKVDVTSYVTIDFSYNAADLMSIDTELRRPMEKTIKLNRAKRVIPVAPSAYPYVRPVLYQQIIINRSRLVRSLC